MDSSRCIIYSWMCFDLGKMTPYNPLFHKTLVCNLKLSKKKLINREALQLLINISPCWLRQACWVGVTVQFLPLNESSPRSPPAAEAELGKKETNQAPSQVTAAGNVSAFGWSQVTRRHRRCEVLIHKSVWVWAGGEGDNARLLGLAGYASSLPLGFILLLLLSGWKLLHKH